MKGPIWRRFPINPAHHRAPEMAWRTGNALIRGMLAPYGSERILHSDGFDGLVKDPS